MLKQIYHILALLAILHLLVLIGLGAYMASTGGLNAEKIEKIATVIRGEEDKPAARTATSQPTVQPVLAMASGEKIADTRRTEEIRRLMGERLLREAADRKALIDAAMLKVTRRLEDLDKEKAQFEEARKTARQADEATGLQAELAILQGLSEKKARDVLMKKQIPDAVNLLLKMKKRTAAGIIEACKTETEKAWAVQVLQEIANQDEDSAKRMAPAAG
ncbi:MAG: hypothetical protein JXQ73_24960 [Phycisphaerae bacterium]|nr:hypothetical protein [Phycisphaerae bacterium]